MHYFSGFAFCGESQLFEPWIDYGTYSVVGFSRGAQKAVEFALQSKQRIDRLVLLSPAVFDGMDEQFVRTQLFYYRRDRQSYLRQFYNNVAYPAEVGVLAPFMCDEDGDALAALLRYRWDRTKLASLKGRGVEVRVYVGMLDRIVSYEHVVALFEPYAQVFAMQGRGHALLR